MPILLIFILLCSGVEAFSQDGAPVKSNLTSSASPTQTGQEQWLTFGKDESYVSVFDKNGQAFLNSNEDASGSPFFLSGWTYGRIRLRDSTGYTNIRLRLDVLNQKVHYLDLNRVDMVLPKGFIREIVLKDSSSKAGPKDYIFRTGFPPVDNQDIGNFYRILASGKLILLESIRKVMVTQKNEVSGEEKKEFNEYDEYYLYQNGQIQRLKKDKASILSLMADQQNKISAFMETNKTNFKSIDDIGRLIAYYDSISP